jgi:hypothetical protein
MYIFSLLPTYSIGEKIQVLAQIGGEGKRPHRAAAAPAGEGSQK